MPGNRLELNARLAASLDAPVLMVLDANSATGIDDLVNKALVSRNGLTEERAEVMGLIVNKVSPPDDTAGPYPLSSASSSSCIQLFLSAIMVYLDGLVNKALVSRNGLTEECAEVMGLIMIKVTSSDDIIGPGLPQRPHRGARQGHGPHRQQGNLIW